MHGSRACSGNAYVIHTLNVLDLKNECRIKRAQLPE
jgi:hypothetical protein